MMIRILLVSLLSLVATQALADGGPNALFNPGRCQQMFLNSRFENYLEHAFYAEINEKRKGFLTQIEHYRDATATQFINTPVAGTGRLGEPFVAMFKPLTGDVYGMYQAHEGGTAPEIPMTVLRDPQHLRQQIPTAVWSDKLYYDHDTSLGNPLWQMQGTSEIFYSKRRSLESLYDSFASQGPERQILVDIVKKQDVDESARTTHFLINDFSRAMAHAQILVSERPEEPLHIEAQWKGVKIPGKRRGEIGRLFFFGPKDVDAQDFWNRKHWDGLEDSGALTRLTLFQKLLSWANHDVALDSLSIQVNTAVFKILGRIGIPMELGRHDVVSQEFEGKKVEEHLVVFEREQMLKAEAKLQAKIVTLHLMNFLDRPDFEAGKVILRFSRNEIGALIDLGLFGEQTAAMRSGLSATPEIAPDAEKTSFVRSLSSDFIKREKDRDGFFISHMMLPTQAEKGQIWKGSIPAIKDVLSPHPDFSRGIFRLDDPARELPKARVLELHFSRSAAEATLRQLKSQLETNP